MSEALGRVPGKGFSVALFSVTAVPERRYQSVVIGTILTLVAVRLVFAGMAPLSFDESLYWLWSKHIAGGYLDHPPVNPILIRIGTTLFGDTEFGVRAIGVLLALPASWAIWRSGAILFNDDRIGATAALYFNLTIVMVAGSALSTPDNALVVSTAFLLFTLVKLWKPGAVSGGSPSASCSASAYCRNTRRFSSPSVFSLGC